MTSEKITTYIPNQRAKTGFFMTWVIMAKNINGFNVLMGLLMYITPVIYSSQVDSRHLQTIMTYNPLTYLVGNVRDMIIYGTFPHPDRFLYASLFAVVIFLFSWRLFFVSEEKVIEKMI